MSISLGLMGDLGRIGKVDCPEGEGEGGGWLELRSSVKRYTTTRYRDKDLPSIDDEGK
jgi:hypothetical protein